MAGRGHSLLIVVGIAALLFFTRLDLPLLEPQEARYAEIPRQMLLADSWLTPVLHGQPYLDKPPLLYWLVMTSYRLLGVHDWAARLVPGLCCLFTVLVVHAWGRRVAGARAGLAGALVLCLSARYVYLGRMLGFDTLLCLWVTSSLAAAHIHLTGGGRGWWLLSALACGLGVLTKGPVAVVLVAVPVLVVPRVDRGTTRTGSADWLLFLCVIAAVAAPWFVVMARTHPDFLHTYFWQHHVVRFVEPFDHREPFWFHLPGLLLGLLPWTLLLPRLVGELKHRRTDAAPLAILVLAAGWGLLFFSLSGCKRAVYVLPVLPPLALALGYTLVSLPAPTFVRWLRAGTATFAILLVAMLALSPWNHERFALRSCVEACTGTEAAVACYPRSWDSVSFYLRRADVRVFSVDQREELLGALRRSRRTLLFVKAGAVAEDLLGRLPSGTTFRKEREHDRVLIGWIESPLAGQIVRGLHP